METKTPMESGSDEMTVGELGAILRKAWWKIVLVSLAAGIVTFMVMLAKPNVYRATAVITPPVEEKRQNPAVGVLASFGVDLGSPNKVEDLETLFKSKDLSVRVFRKYNLWPIVFRDRYDPASGKIKGNWLGSLSGGGKGTRFPSDWDAIRAANDRLIISINKRNNTVSVSFDAYSPESSANIVGYYLDEGKNRLQEEALDRAMKNKKFIEEQIVKTVDALTRDRLYSLYSQEVEREMMGRNREQFGFRLVDTSRVPDRKIRPRRVLSALLGSGVMFLAGCVFFALSGKWEGRGTEGRK